MREYMEKPTTAAFTLRNAPVHATAHVAVVQGQVRARMITQNALK
jgi:hypothetical protein